ncbi:MAG TPA: TIGR02757 family protein [Thermoanaerobaculia bacterium]|nr:TIGR02757 family protein [Thermoanaerobaculia bacterium]
MALSPRELLLADRLERLYESYGPETASTDPILFLGRYEAAEDLEVVGWIASAFAYGRVETIQANVARILAALGPRPAAALDRISDFRELASDALGGFRHRFHGGDDAAVLLFAISRARLHAGSVRAFFEAELRPEDRDVGPLLSRAVAKIGEFDYRPVAGRRRLPPSSPAKFFFPDPASGSACKRWNMYLRWMVRRDRLDLGLWAGIPTDRLVIPTDTHIHLVSRRLRLTRRKTADWRTAREITDRLARIDPKDPVRYDYALCRLGILQICKPQRGLSRCAECPVREPCSVGGPKLFPLTRGQRMAS